GLDQSQLLQLLESPHEYVRAWTIRLIGDSRRVSTTTRDRFVEMAWSDSSVIVRSQLACTAKRLTAADGLPIVSELLGHDEDIHDAHLPLLIWWAIEEKVVTDSDSVLKLFESDQTWQRPMARQIVLERLARRFMAEGTANCYASVAQLFRQTRNLDDRNLLLRGMLQALSGKSLDATPTQLTSLVERWLGESEPDLQVIEFGVRCKISRAQDSAIQRISDSKTPNESRLALIRALSESRTSNAINTFLSLVDSSMPEAIQLASINALGVFQEKRIAKQLLKSSSNLGKTAQSRIIEVVCSRSEWAHVLKEAIEDGALKPDVITVDQVRQLRKHNEQTLTSWVEKVWGRIQTETPLEKQGRITALSQILAKEPGSGDASRGQEVFNKICANCHKLHGTGNMIGPDLTGADRKNRELFLRNIVDPSAMIREQYLTQVAATKDGRIVTGLLADSNADTITLLDAKNVRTILNRRDLEELKESPVSLMPEKLLDTLTDQQLRDLFKYFAE
ncbi:MAG: c-type cytochrome, partial [Planctomycetes bacterium]|nr:c-type cytochrome [Planctomycetota bacterium]